jgi:hypothetical protein
MSISMKNGAPNGAPKRKPRRVILIFGALLALFGGMIVACGSPSATSSDMCAYTQGTGQSGADADVHEIYYPGEQFTVGQKENAYYFPCNARNIRLEPGSTDVDAQGNQVSSVTARTSTGNLVTIDVVMYWTLNEDKDVLKNVFIPWCNKYQCASSDSSVRNDNFSTNGWSLGILGENGVPFFQNAVKDVVQAQDDNIWKNPADAKADLASKISQRFMDSFHAATGSTENVFCASGESSGWSGDVGTSSYNCGSVRISVNNIVPSDSSLLDNAARMAKAESDKAANQAQLDAAKAKYGDAAPQVLGYLDIIQACKAAEMTVCSAGGMTVGTQGSAVVDASPTG